MSVDETWVRAAQISGIDRFGDWGIVSLVLISATQKSKMAGAVMGDDSAEGKENAQTAPDLETQKKDIGLLLKAPLLKGETW